MRDSRRQRQQLSTEGDMALLEEELESVEEDLSEELLDELLPLCCSGSAEGRWAADVWSWRRRDASAGLDMDAEGVWRKAKSGLVGSANVKAEYSEDGLMLGVSELKCAEEVGTAMLK
jgi:hypothetical protein